MLFLKACVALWTESRERRQALDLIICTNFYRDNDMAHMMNPEEY